MVDVEQLKKEEIEELTKTVTLESLILEGVETKVPPLRIELRSLL